MVRFPLLSAVFFLALASSAIAATCPQYDEAQHASGCAQVSVSPANVRPGETLTVSVQLNCGGASVFASYAQADGIIVDGVPMTGSGGPPPNYHGTAVYPDAGFQVPISGNGGHTVVFKIRADAPDKCVSSDQFGAYGPWVSVGSGSSWSTPVDFNIDRAAGRTCSLQMNAATPRPGEAKPGEIITYTLAASCDSAADRLSLAIPLPSGTVLVPASITGGGTFAKGHLTWRAEGVASKSVEFKAQVRDTKFLKRIDTILANGRLTAELSGETATDSVKIETKVAKPTQVKGRVLDAKLLFPKKTNVDEKSPIAKAKVELVDSMGAVVDSETADSSGRYEVDAGDVGTYTLRVTVKADVYSSASNGVNAGGVDLVQERTIEVTDLKAPPQTVDVLVPRGILAHAAAALRGLNSLEYAAAGIVPLAFRVDTTVIEAEIGFLIDAKTEYVSALKPHAPNRWDGLVRFSAVASTMDDRFRDMAIAVDDLAKIVPTAILITLMQQSGSKFAEKYAGIKSPGQLPPPTAGSRSVEALKIFSLSYVIGNVLPPLLDRLGVEGTTKATIIEVVYKATRFGLNVFVPGMNTGDAVFEVILQSSRAAIFAGLITGVRVDLQAELDNAVGKFVASSAAGDHAAALSALDLFDARIADRSEFMHKEATAALAAISIAIRGSEGVLFKVQSALGLVKDANAIQKGIKKALAPVTKVLSAAKNKLFIPIFATAGAMAGSSIVLVPIDLHRQIDGAFLGFTPGDRPLDLRLDQIPDWKTSWKKLTGFADDQSRGRARLGTALAAKAPPVPPSIPEFVALLARLDAVAALLAAGDANGYGLAADDFVADLDDLAAILVPLVDESFASPWDTDERFGVFVSKTLKALQSLTEAIVAADAWSIEPSKSLASVALKALKTARGDLLAAGQAADAVLPALTAAAPGPKLLVAIRGLDDGAAPDADLPATIEIRNVGAAPATGATLSLEATPGLVLVGNASVALDPIAPGVTASVPITVHTSAAQPVLVGLTAVVSGGTVPIAGAEAVFVIGE